ncbi:hypothetical protein ACGFMK_19965 [Amycolatopsis sp. NPDC049252]
MFSPESVSLDDHRSGDTGSTPRPRAGRDADGRRIGIPATFVA